MNSRFQHISGSDQALLWALESLIEKYAIEATTGSSFLRDERAKKANYVREQWQQIQKRIDRGIGAGSIQLPLSYALFELRRLMRDEKVQNGKFNSRSLKSYLLGYHYFLNEMAKEEFKQFQDDAREAHRSNRNLSYLTKTPLKPKASVFDIYKDEVLPLPAKEREQRYQVIVKRQFAGKKYTPGQVYQISLHALHRDLTYQNSFATQSQRFHTATSKAAGHEFLRADGKVIKYFHSIHDADIRAPQGKGQRQVERAHFLDVDDWCMEFGRNINEDELVIVPLLQIQHGRRHFNTIVICNKHIYIIEPRSTNIARDGAKPIIYPTKAIGDALLSAFPDYTFSNIFVGQPRFFNDIDGAAHHLNYAETLCTLTDDVLNDKKKLTSALEQTQLSRRAQDETILNRMDFVGGQFSAGNPFAQPLDLHGNFNLDGEEQRQSYIGEQLGLSHENKYRNDIKMATEEMQGYLKHANKHHNFFHPHTRNATADFLKLCASSFKAGNRNERLRLSMMFYASYISISDKSSGLRKHLEKALVNLLDCSTEYAALKDSSLPTTKNIEHLFSQRLHGEMLVVAGSEITDYSKALDGMKTAMKTVDDIDAGIVSKIVLTKAKVKERQEAITDAYSLMNNLKVGAASHVTVPR